MKKLKWYFHVHHDILLEPLIRPLKDRIDYIKEYKPKNEIKLRLKLLKPVKGKLPNEVVKTGETYIEAAKVYVQADKFCDKAWEDCDKTWKVYKKTLKKYSKEINKLHKQECPNCPWNGKTIFPTSRSQK